MLVKQEVVCQGCDKQFIIICNEHEHPELGFCPFCTSAIEDIVLEDGEEQ